MTYSRIHTIELILLIIGMLLALITIGEPGKCTVHAEKVEMLDPKDVNELAAEVNDLLWDIQANKSMSEQALHMAKERKK